MSAPFSKKDFYKSKASWEAFTEEVEESGELTFSEEDLRRLLQLTDTLFQLADHLYKKQGN